MTDDRRANYRGVPIRCTYRQTRSCLLLDRVALMAGALRRRRQRARHDADDADRRASPKTFSGTLHTVQRAHSPRSTSQNAGDVIVQVTALDPDDTVVGLSHRHVERRRLPDGGLDRTGGAQFRR